ncbi:hypothetical protein, partial [Salmonella sp. S146_54837]|uniref:hypothetical protein n=1 Tax=Salmonella sp. S146_54837 TaxID=2665635 RepID=UPI00165949DE
FDRFGGASFTFGNIIRDVTAHFNTDFDLEELQKFGDGRDFGSASRSYQQMIDQTKTNIAWMKNYAGIVSESLVANTGC